MFLKSMSNHDPDTDKNNRDYDFCHNQAALPLYTKKTH